MSEDHMDRIRRDLTKATCEELQEIVNRRARIAAQVLDTADIAMMLYEIASSFAMGAMVFAAQNAKPDTDPHELLDDIVASMGRLLTSRKPTVLAAAGALRVGGSMADAHAAARACANG